MQRTLRNYWPLHWREYLVVVLSNLIIPKQYQGIPEQQAKKYISCGFYHNSRKLPIFSFLILPQKWHRFDSRYAPQCYTLPFIPHFPNNGFVIRSTLSIWMSFWETVTPIWKPHHVHSRHVILCASTIVRITFEVSSEKSICSFENMNESRFTTCTHTCNVPLSFVVYHCEWKSKAKNN